MIKHSNLGIRFLLELGALTSLAVWGFRTPDSWWVKVPLGAGAPVLAAVLWGAFVSPKARFVVAEPGRLSVEVLVFGAAVAALAASGWPEAAVVFAGAAIGSRALKTWFDSQDN